MEQIQFFNADTLIETLPLKLMYKERKSEAFLYRLSAAVPNSNFYNILQSQHMRIVLTNAIDTIQFEPTNSAQRTMNRIELNMQDYLQCKHE